MGKLVDLSKKTFGRLTVVRRAENSKTGGARWLCKCMCGKFKIVFGGHLHRGLIQSCRCLHNEGVGKINFKHGHARAGKKTIEYGTWRNMIKRCYAPYARRFERYGGRGIRVCKRWRYSFQNFLEDMGPKPKGLTLDRINPNSNYTPRNCRWATPSQQRLNQVRNFKRLQHIGGQVSF